MRRLSFIMLGLMVCSVRFVASAQDGTVEVAPDPTVQEAPSDIPKEELPPSSSDTGTTGVSSAAESRPQADTPSSVSAASSVVASSMSSSAASSVVSTEKSSAISIISSVQKSSVITSRVSSKALSSVASSSSSISVVAITATGSVAHITDRTNFGYNVPIVVLPATSLSRHVLATNAALGLIVTLVIALCGMALFQALSLSRQRTLQLLHRAPFQALLTWIMLQILALTVPSAFAQGAETVASSGVMHIPLWGLLFFIVVGATNLLFDNILIAEGKVIDVWIGRTIGSISGEDARNWKKSPWVVLLLILAYGLLGAYLNSAFSLMPTRNVGMIVVAVITVMIAGYSKDFLRFSVAKKWKCSAWFQAHVIGLVIAFLCVAMSRELGLSPGFLYGLPVGLCIVIHHHARSEGTLEFFSFAFMLVLAGMAYFVLPFIETYQVLHDFCSLLFVILVEGMFLELLPLPYVPGGTLFEWRKSVWAIEFFCASFFLYQTILNPQGSVQSLDSSPPTMASLFILGIVALGILILWAMVLRKRHAHT